MEIIRRPFPVTGSPEEGVAVVAIGDIHGRYDLFKQALSCVKKALKALPEKPKQVDLVLLGDLIDRGENSGKVLDLVHKGIKGYNIIPLMGNHEQLLLNILDANMETYCTKWRLWRGNGGQATLESLPVNIPAICDLDAEGHKKVLLKKLGQKRIDFINGFKSHYRSGNILCVHAGIDPTKSLAENFEQDHLSQSPKHWAWIRDGFLNHHGPFPEGVFVVHGHTVIPGPKLEPHRIGLDTGACLYGVLSGAVFYNHEMMVFQVTPD